MTDINVEDLIYILPFELQDIIWRYYWRHIWTSKVIDQLDTVLKHRLYGYTEEMVFNLGSDKKIENSKDIIVIKPLKYMEVENSDTCPRKINTTYYGYIKYKNPYEISLFRDSIRPWKVTCYVDSSIHDDSVPGCPCGALNWWFHEEYSDKMFNELYEFESKNLPCPIITTLDKVMDFWRIGDKYFDKSDYGHLLTKVDTVKTI